MSFLHIWLKWSDNLKVSDLSQFSLILDGRKLRLEEGTWLAGGDTASLYKARSLLDISVSTQAFLTANEYYHMASNIWNFILLPVPGWKAQLKLMFGYLATPLPSDKEGWVPKNWCFRAVVPEKTLESPWESKGIPPVHPKGNQSWIFVGTTDAEAPILWPPDAKGWLTEKDPDAGKDWGQEKDDRG